MSRRYIQHALKSPDGVFRRGFLPGNARDFAYRNSAPLSALRDAARSHICIPERKRYGGEDLHLISGFVQGVHTGIATLRISPQWKYGDPRSVGHEFCGFLIVPAPDIRRALYSGFTTLRRFSHNFMSFIFLRRSRCSDLQTNGVSFLNPHFSRYAGASML